MDSHKIVMYALGGLLAVAVFKILSPHSKFAPDPDDSGWTQAVEQARTSGRPAVVLFSANWCPTCQSLSQNVLSRDDIMEELDDHYVFYVVDLTDPSRVEAARSRKFGVRYIPQLIRYDKDGNETARANYLDPRELMDWLKAGE